MNHTYVYCFLSWLVYTSKADEQCCEKLYKKFETHSRARLIFAVKSRCLLCYNSVAAIEEP